MDGEDAGNSGEVPQNDSKPAIAASANDGASSEQDPGSAVDTPSHSPASGAAGISSDGTASATVDEASEKPLAGADGVSTLQSEDQTLKESPEKDGASVTVVSTTPNVVVEKVGGGLMSWNLTAATGGNVDGEGKETGSIFPLDLGGASTILTQDQILKIDAALKSEQIKSEPNPLLQGPPPPQENMESIPIEEPEDHQEVEEKIQLNIDSVLDIGPGSFSTKHLMNQVMSSEILMEAIGDDGLAATVAVATANSDDESEGGSTTDSTSEKKKEDNLKRRSARIAHITANDLTLRQAMREKEQKKKEREEKKRQKEEEKKAKDSKNVRVVEGDSDTLTAQKEKGKSRTDISSEIEKYLKVIDQEIKQSEEQKDGDPKKEEEEEVKKEVLAEQKEATKKQEEDKDGGKKTTGLNLFESLGKAKPEKEVKGDTVKEDILKETTVGNKEKEKPSGSSQRPPDDGSQRPLDAETKSEVGQKLSDSKDELELGEVKEEKETGELSDDENGHPESKSSVYWMDHSYAASSALPVSSNVPATTPGDSPTKRSTRSESRKEKSSEEPNKEKKAEEKPRRSSRRESKVSTEEEGKEAKEDKKSKSKHDHKDKKTSKGKKDKERHSRSRSKEKSSSKEKERHRRESRSKSVDDSKEKDKKKKKHKERDKEKEESRKKKSSRSSRDIKKTKLGADELSDIPFSSEEEPEAEEAEQAEHDTGSDWTSDDDPEKLWCICRQPHDGKFMICCDKCEDWFHGKCVNITKKEGKRMERENLSWMCPKCTEEKKTEAADKSKAKDDKSKKSKQETDDSKDAHSKEKARRKSRDRRREEEMEDEEEYIDEEDEKKKKRGKAGEEKKRKRKSDAGTKKDSESKKEPEEEVASKKKRLKFFRPPPPKQHCIGTRCENWARAGSVYCSPGCIVKHAKESMKLLAAEKERATGLKGRRDSAGGSAGTPTQSLKLREDERISVIERHTGRLRTGLTAPTYEELPYWLGRHPTYEVLRPNIKHGYTASAYSPGKGSSKHKSESRRLSHEGESSRNLSSSDSERKISTKQITSPTKDGANTGADDIERRQRERREKVRMLLEMKRREEEARERELERKRMEESRRKREEEKREEEERKKREDEKRRKEDRERREREKREKEERLRLQAENSKLAEQTSESVRVNVKRTLLDVLLTRVKKAPDVKNVTADDVKKVSKQVEFELYKLYNDTGAKYKAKYRTLIFNIKDMKNKGLFRHILKGEISPRNLVRMSSDQLASKELMKWREQEAKHELEMIVQTEQDKKSMPMTIVKKTHKGEVELGEEDNLGELVPHTKVEEETLKRSKRPSTESELKSPSRPSFGSPTRHHSGSSPTTPSSPTTLTTMLIDTTEQHKAHLFDLNCKICTGKIPAPKEEKVAKKKAIVRKTPKIKKVAVGEEKKRGGIVKEKPVKFFGEEIEEIKPKVKSVTEDLYDDLMETVGGGEDDDDDDDAAAVIISETVEESTTPPGSPPPPVVVRTAPKPVKEKKASRPSQVKRSVSSTALTPTPAWRGFIFMHEVSKFVAVAHHVSGPAQSITLDLQDTLEVCGRIPYKVVWDYFTKLKQSQSTEMTIVRFHVWQEDEEPAFFALFDYFYTRQRIGVIGKNRPHVKDFYLIALPSSDKVPHHILPFNGPGLPSNRPHLMLGVVVRHKDKQRSMSLDAEVASKPISQTPREPPPVHHVPKRKTHHQPTHDIAPPENTMSSFHSSVPSMREISDMMAPKDSYPKQQEMYVTEDQLVDPIVAQYANADPKELEVELEEPYSPTREEREAPYDPSDPTDDWQAGRSMPASAVIPEPALYPQVPPVAIQEDKEVVKADDGTESGVKATDIASVAADASQDILSSFSDQSGLSEQQQLLIQLTKQVEEAKRALLDRQIESLQSEINKATGKLGKTDEQTSDEAGTSPDVRLAQADSSTMTPKDDATSTPGGTGSDPAQETTQGGEDVQPLCPPPNLPPFAVGAVLWNAVQGPTLNPPVPQAVTTDNNTVSSASSTSPALTQDVSHQQQQPVVPREQPTAYPQKDFPRYPDPMPHHDEQGSQPAHHPHSTAPPHAPLRHPGPPLSQGQHPAPFQPPPITHPSTPHHQSAPHQPPIRHQPHLPPRLPRPPGPRAPLVPHHPPPVAPSVPVTKKRKLEPPPPGEEGWKYGDDDDEGEVQHSDDPGPMAPRKQPPRDVDFRRDVDLRQSTGQFEDTDERRPWEVDKPREAWAKEHWERSRRGEREPWPRQEWGPKGDRGRGRGHDWSRDYSDRDEDQPVRVDYGHRSNELKDPRMGRDRPISRDYGHGSRPR
ncbi:death-inducer obliterator 1-like isoform X2 [Lytechinus variegatus]|uniref:death-inducer obliterator 1-like isoform X2 n=1 Tax=Lytechinus variegatus TaxID=7654 RepID=UPI001BB226B6|nr:death-inducer obliterator 1-like isoform X2 [Lytechinus variegatus]